MKLFVRLLFALAASLLPACGSVPSSNPQPLRGDLSFAVVTETDIGLHLRGQNHYTPLDQTGAQNFAALSEALHEPQSFPALDIEARSPEFLLVCGNVTEGGNILENWSAAEELFDALGLLWFAAAGRVDMTHGQVLEGFNKRFGGLVYSFDRSGAHFIALCSPSLCDPRPCFSPLQLSWLREDLARNADRKPVFVFVHHAPDSPQLAPAQILELQAAFDGHDVAAVFFGARYGTEASSGVRREGALDCVQSGVMAGENAGYVLASVAAGKLRVAYRYLDPARQPRLLLEKTLRHRPHVPLTILEPQDGAPARDSALSILVRAPSAPLSFRLDGEPQSLEWTREQGAWRASFSLRSLLAEGSGGAHQIAVGCDDEGTPRLSTRVFIAPSEKVQMRWRRSFEGSMRASPVLAGNGLAIASTAGEVAVLDPESGELKWSVRTAAVLGSPLGCSDGSVVIGNIDGWIESFDRGGSLRWRFQAGKPVLVGLVGDSESVFAVDSVGCIHALDLATGVRRWKSNAGIVDDPPFLIEGRLILFTGGGLKRTLDARSGEVLASERVDPPQRIVQGGAAGRIAMVVRRGTVDLLDAETRELSWAWRASQGEIFAAPLVGPDGTVWIAAMDGSLSCVRAR